MNVLTLFSGAEGVGLGLEAAGMTIIGQCEIEPAPRKILRNHWPEVHLWGDIRKVTRDDVIQRIGRPDILVGGFPCQDLSVAGQRAGMAGERSGLYRELLRLTRELDPDWLVVENVPGLLSASSDPEGGAPAGSAMGLFLGDLTGYYPVIPDGGWRNSGVIVGPLGSAAWRVLDAQHFGVAQRRRRVFVVFNPRNRVAPAAVLLEPEGLRWHSSPRVPSWESAPPVAGSGIAGDGPVSTLLAGGGERGYRVDAESAAGGHQVPAVYHTLLAKGNDSFAEDLETYVPLSPALTARYGKGADSDATDALVPTESEAYQCHGGNVGPMGVLRAGNGHVGSIPFVTHALTASSRAATEDGTGRGSPLVPVAVALAVRGREGGAQIEVGDTDGPYNALRAGDGGSSRQSMIGLPSASAVRRLTPLECERLMGWPDNHTAPAGSDSARYKACGNGVVAHVTEWLGCRILDWEDMQVG